MIIIFTRVASYTKEGDSMELETIIEKKCFQLLEKAIAFKASDVHIVPEENEFQIYFRKFGKLVPIQTLPDELGNRLVTYMKFLSGLDISEKRKPQSGSFQKIMEEKLFSFRVSTLPSVYNKECLVIRVLLQNTTVPIPDLALNNYQANKLIQLIEKQQGLLLITGATGTGKTTTLYSLIYHCANQLSRHVISLEDPVERIQKKIVQIQINERAGVTYATGLKAILRHTPDVIMIGEIRDRETAHIALEAALTGHLVLSTVHSKDTVNCLYRLFDLGLSIEELKQSVIGVVAQRLIENRHTDERKAIFELLFGASLHHAFDAMKKKDAYQLPKNVSLEGQISNYELVHNET